MLPAITPITIIRNPSNNGLRFVNKLSMAPMTKSAAAVAIMLIGIALCVSLNKKGSKGIAAPKAKEMKEKNWQRQVRPYPQGLDPILLELKYSVLFLDYLS